MKGVKVMTTAMLVKVVANYNKRVYITSASVCAFASDNDHRDYRSDSSKRNGRLRCLI